MYCAGLILAPKMRKGFKWIIMDVSYTKADKIIKLNTPEESYDVAALFFSFPTFLRAAESRSIPKIS